jgi:hypothetical protein
MSPRADALERFLTREYADAIVEQLNRPSPIRWDPSPDYLAKMAARNEELEEMCWRVGASRDVAELIGERYEYGVRERDG